MPTYQHVDAEKKPRHLGPWIWLALALVLGFFLLTEHRAHLFGALPYLLVLLCPLMHLFMHGDHGGHGHGPAGHDRESDPEAHHES